eukprot:1183193-Prorocentrum_minimum.AAC.2
MLIIIVEMGEAICRTHHPRAYIRNSLTASLRSGCCYQVISAATARSRRMEAHRRPVRCGWRRRSPPPAPRGWHPCPGRVSRRSGPHWTA